MADTPPRLGFTKKYFFYVSPPTLQRARLFDIKCIQAKLEGGALKVKEFEFHKKQGRSTCICALRAVKGIGHMKVCA